MTTEFTGEMGCMLFYVMCIEADPTIIPSHADHHPLSLSP